MKMNLVCLHVCVHVCVTLVYIVKFRTMFSCSVALKVYVSIGVKRMIGERSKAVCGCVCCMCCLCVLQEDKSLCRDFE